MKTIKFRGMMKNGKFLFGDLEQGLNNEMYIRHVVKTGLTSRQAMTKMVEKETVGQYVFTDVHTKEEIFTGDCFRYYNRLGVIRYSENVNGYVLSSDYDEVEVVLSHTVINDKQFEHLGNIHQNSSLKQRIKYQFDGVL